MDMYIYISTYMCILLYFECFYFISANSPVGSTSLCFGKSPSLSSVASGGHHVTTAAGGTWEHLTSSPSTDSFRSTRSGIYIPILYNIKSS